MTINSGIAFNGLAERWLFPEDGAKYEIADQRVELGSGVFPRAEEPTAKADTR
jgi:hypothetical protein